MIPAPPFLYPLCDFAFCLALLQRREPFLTHSPSRLIHPLLDCMTHTHRILCLFAAHQNCCWDPAGAGPKQPPPGLFFATPLPPSHIGWAPAGEEESSLSLSLLPHPPSLSGPVNPMCPSGNHTPPQQSLPRGPSSRRGSIGSKTPNLPPPPGATGCRAALIPPPAAAPPPRPRPKLLPFAVLFPSFRLSHTPPRKPHARTLPDCVCTRRRQQKAPTPPAPRALGARRPTLAQKRLPPRRRFRAIHGGREERASSQPALPLP